VSNKFSGRGLLIKVGTWPFQSGMILKRSSMRLLKAGSDTKQPCVGKIVLCKQGCFEIEN
jgi:hypothetical protein